MRLGVPLDALGALNEDGELPWGTAEWLITIDSTVNRVANEKRSG